MPFAIVAAVAGAAHADRAVTGNIVDDKTGQPVAGALVTVGTGETATDDAGVFRVENLPFGRQDVVVVADGYQAYFGAARVGEAMAIRLAPDKAGGEVIQVTGRAPTGPPLHLSTGEIRTQPGAGNDALRALQSLPGVARTPYGLGGLALRGTAPRDTKVYLDGIEVPLLYHFGGLASFLPTGAIDDITLEPGGASVRYGRGLGGVAVVTSKTGRPDGWRVGGEVSLLDAAAIAEGPGPLRGSWLIGVRRSYFDLIEQAVGLDLTIAPRYEDAQVRWESGDGRWMAILFGSDDRLRLLHDPSSSSEGGVDTSNVSTLTYGQRFARLGLRYRAIVGATALTITPSLGVDEVVGRAVQNDIDKGIHRVTVPLALRADVSTPLAGGTLLVGVDGGAYRNYYDVINTPPANPSDPNPTAVLERSLTRWDADFGAFVEESWFFAGDRIEVRPGLRGDHFGLSEQWTLDPRLAVHEHLPHDITLTQSVGTYHEPPLITDYDPIFMRKTPMLGSIATQAALGAKAIIGDDKEVSATVYYQDLRQLPVDVISGATPISANGSVQSGGALAASRELLDSEFGSYTYREAVGNGHAYGVELIARKTLGELTGWVAYTYSRSLRQSGPEQPWLPYVLDQPHALTIVATRTLGPAWRIGARMRYASGNPFTPVASATYNPDTNKYTAVDGPLLSERLPAFFQLDLRVDHGWHGDWGTLDLFLDVQNATWRDNAEGIAYSKDYATRHFTGGFPIFPALGIEYIP